MSLGSGARLGAYEIVRSIGAGGMGEVYRAHDPRLGRDVAIKMLPASFAEDPDRLRRFEREARTAGALHHPNLVTVFDVGSHEGGPFLVMELLEGASLRMLLADRPLPVRKAIEYAAQIALGLSAAHESGIVHRDLKPENLFVTRDERVKILDFGLARSDRAQEAVGSEVATATQVTGLGVVLGTVGYMSPEQVAGKTADPRSDIFSFGAVLYEMLSGRRAFRGATAVDTMHAILNSDPSELSTAERPTPPMLERIVQRCLDKDPGRRFRSAHDLAFALEGLSGSGPASRVGPGPARPSGPRRAAMTLALGLGGLALLVAGYLAGSRTERPAPTFQRLTFRRGQVGPARFADEKTIVYSAAWDGQPREIYTTRTDSPEARSLGLKAGLQSVSSKGELAIADRGANTLAQVPLGGGTPRPLLDDVTAGGGPAAADWAPDGKSLAVIRGGERLEYPPGKTLFQSKRGIGFPRFSPSGDHLAFFDGDWQDAAVVVVDLQGKVLLTTRRWKRTSGLAWTPRGDEIWFAAADVGTEQDIHAVTPGGHVRKVIAFPGGSSLQDISKEGRVLLSRGNRRQQIAGLFPGEAEERDLSWLDFSMVAAIAGDGRTILFTERGTGAGRTNAVYLRTTDGAPAVRLGEGTARSLSPDGKWAEVVPTGTDGLRIVLLPTGAGEAKTLSLEPLTEAGAIHWFPDSQRFVVCGREPGRRLRCYAVDVASGTLLPLTPEGVSGVLEDGASVSPDGRFLLVQDARDLSLKTAPIAIYSIQTGELRPLPGLGKPENVPLWSADGRALLAHTHERRDTRLVRFDFARAAWQEFGKVHVADPAGLSTGFHPVLTPDGRYYAYSFIRDQSDLYLAEGLR